MNTNNIISIITYTLKTNFPNVIDVYKEDVPQDFITPSFLVEKIEGKYNHAIGRKYKKHIYLSIKYFPSNNNLNTNQELNNIADELFEKLEMMQYNGMIIKGQNMNSKIDDDVLHFFIDVKVSMVKDNTSSKFTELEGISINNG